MNNHSNQDIEADLKKMISDYVTKAVHIHAVTASLYSRSFRGFDHWSSSDRQWRDDTLAKIRSQASHLSLSEEALQEMIGICWETINKSPIRDQEH